VPYLAAGLGAAHASGKFLGTVTADLGLFPMTGVRIFYGDSTSFQGNGGIGARIYVGKHWGVEPELKVTRYTGDLGFTAVRYRAGLFFEFGK
jgi:hypothetical protein